MIEKTYRSEKNNEIHWPNAGETEPDFFVICSPRGIHARLISPNAASHDKHFIVISHSSHVTVKWAGRAATLPT